MQADRQSSVAQKPQARRAFLRWVSASLAGAALGSSAVGSRLSAQQPNSPEITPESRRALDRGLLWLQRNQGPEGNWGTKDLGLVSLGALAFLADGHAPQRSRYGEATQAALDYVLRNAHPNGLLNISGAQRDMYNHGLSTFVLGQAYGMTGDARIGPTLDRALKLIANTQCDDGGWQYRAQRQPRGHDLSLAVMQAKALRSAVDIGLEVPPAVIELAIRSVREHYQPLPRPSRMPDEATLRSLPGQFTYTRSGNGSSLAMAACGVVCLQEFGQYDDWRIAKNMDVILAAVRQIQPQPQSGELPLDAYTLYYVAQAAYQVGGAPWREIYPVLRDTLIANQMVSTQPQRDGMWRDMGRVPGSPDRRQSRTSGPGNPLYGTSVGCFVLAMPNRFLPILQEGRIEALQGQFSG